jgi:RND family efflux transporter MFP subunit
VELSPRRNSNQSGEAGFPNLRVCEVGLLIVLTLVAFNSAACVGNAAKDQKAEAPAKVENPHKETELTTVTLTAEAEQRLGIQVATVAHEPRMRTQTFSGEVVLPPDSTFTVTAPVAGTLQRAARGTALPASGMWVRKGQVVYQLLPYMSPAEQDQRELVERDAVILVSAAANEVNSATAKLEAAKARAQRAEQLVRDGGGSVKAAEAEHEQVRLADVALNAAREKLVLAKRVPPQKIEPVPIVVPRSALIQTVHAGPRQTVAAGTTLLDAADYQRVLIRVPVYVGDLKWIPVQQNAQVHGLSDSPGTAARTARPVAAPPSADPNAATADLYFELSNTDFSLRPGQRVGVTLRLLKDEEGLTVPWSAVLHDVDGGSWVYEVVEPHKYVRRRVAVRRVDGDTAILAQGPTAGTQVVVQGASELFGSEFGAGK